MSNADHPGTRAARSDPRLADTIAFKMILAMNLMVRPFLEEHSRRYSLTLSEWRAMIILAARPGLSGIEIADTLYMEKMTVSRSLRSMEKAGRVVRRKDPSDLKRNRWQLTDAGWSVFDALVGRALDRQAEMLSSFDAKERTAFSNLLDKLLKG